MNTATQETSDLKEIKQEVIQFSNELLRFTIAFGVYIYSRTIEWGSRAKEDFSVKSIKTHGLVQVLCARAMRFFGINEEKGNEKQSTKRYLRRSVLKKTLLFPLYLLITSVEILFYSKIRQKKNKKLNKKVNRYNY
jgi:hypothetical protein